MSYKQIITPNLNANARIGMCLEYVQNAYASNWAGSSAWDAWSNRVAHKHADSNFPADVLIPIWFSGTWRGHYYGHVAILNTRTGQVYTSPYFKSTGVEVYDSINAMVSVFRNAMPDIRYVGWSEDIGGIRVIRKGEDMPITKEQENELSILATGSYPGKDYNYKFTGTTNYDGFYQHWAGVSRSHGLIKKTTTQDKRLKELEAQKKDGFVEVSEKLYRKVGK